MFEKSLCQKSSQCTKKSLWRTHCTSMVEAALEEQRSASQVVLKRKTAFQFKGCTDVQQLKEAIHVRPFEAPLGDVKKRWVEVTEHLQRVYGDSTILNGVRKRYDDLMAARGKMSASLRASGTKEE
ncbi:hypothetical protein Ae201684P_018833 [Aphanomyces euteiches]|uniref:Uncharacterized protein n=1 Tax=Aphanomyces euteiches TaxID=100861 RepID=A0A6G0WE92_9STRA|nr:hypothetical protein Ae201684_015798 [Aphanomyces euteiches]KAH9099824.1 hypothetical protein Ae201684P_018833 [Aphanomyces euteiches]